MAIQSWSRPFSGFSIHKINQNHSKLQSKHTPLEVVLEIHTNL